MELITVTLHIELMQLLLSDSFCSLLIMLPTLNTFWTGVDFYVAQMMMVRFPGRGLKCILAGFPPSLHENQAGHALEMRFNLNGSFVS